MTTSSVKYRGHYEPLQGGIYHVPFPDPLSLRRCRGGAGADDGRDRGAVRDDCYPDDVAAFIVEPILGEGGYVIPPDTFLPALREVADRHGILLITDEIQTGYGRTGKFFASEWTGAVPDIVVMAKGIASGLPLSGIMARRSLIEKFPPSSHGGTYGGNVVACAAALATLDVIEDEGLVANAARQGARLLDGLRRATAGNPPWPRCAVAASWSRSTSPIRKPARPGRTGQGAPGGRVRAKAAAADVRHLRQRRSGDPAADHDGRRGRPGDRHH